MTLGLLRWGLVPICLLVAAVALAQVQSGAGRSVLEIHQRATENPGNPDAFNAYLRTLPRVEVGEGRSYYVFEGDLLLTRDEVRLRLLERVERNKKSSSFTPELLVNTLDGRPDFWQARSSRRLTYSVDRNSFADSTQYTLMVENMKRAAADWMAACATCGISFEHVAATDGAPSLDKVTFIVKRLPTDGPYVATAFFPSDQKFKRYLFIYPAYFRTTFFDKVGVLRHELGHVLGYRHEQTRGVSGCDYEDGNWKSLTEYDPKSVMHYFCGDGGTKAMQLTELDKAGHLKQYDDGSAPAIKPQSLILRLEGGEIAENIFKLTVELAQQALLPKAEYVVRPGDSICSIYMQTMQFPEKVNCSDTRAVDLHNFLNEKNPKSKGVLTVGEKIFVPSNLFLRPYSYSRIYKKEAKAEQLQFAADRTKWNVISVSPFSNDNDARVRFAGYEMLVPLPDQTAAQRALKSFARFESPNIYVDSTTRSLGGFPKHSVKHPSEYFEECQNGTGSPGEASYSALFGMPKLPACALKCDGPKCSRLILIDSKVSPNLDLYGGVESGVDFGNPDAAAMSEAASRCITIRFKKEYHGTHLAGIMVSQSNGFGFVGLSPGSKLVALDSQIYTDQSLAGYISDMDENSNMRGKIFVYAGTFPTYNSSDILTNSGRLKSSELRFTRSLAANRIRGSRPTWVTAAGQQDDGRPIELSPDTPMAPMNMGDLENVIVVTACEDCSDMKAKLLPQVNFSGRIVAVAAPGKAIAGLADSQRISATDGSSQATAFVAGVVGAMYNCYQDWYEPAKVRRRLMLTARPSFDQSEYDKVQSGIVNPELALLDPEKNWIKLKGGALHQANIAGWCSGTGSISMNEFFRDVNSGSETYQMASIRRITKYARVEQGDPVQWVIFWKTLDLAPYDIARSKPGKSNPNMNLIKLTDGSAIQLGQIEELLLSAPIRRMVACR